MWRLIFQDTHQTILTFDCWNKESITGVFIDGLRILIVYLNDLKGLRKIILLWLYVWKWNPLSMKNYFLFVSVGSIAKLGSTKLWKSENANSRFWNALRWGKTKAKSKFYFVAWTFGSTGNSPQNCKYFQHVFLLTKIKAEFPFIFILLG